MANQTKSLVANITATATWTQLKDESTGSVYTVPSTGRADVKSFIVNNLGANSVTIEFAISPDNTPTDEERSLPGCVLAAQYEHAEYDGVIVIIADKGLWVKCTGTSPNVSVRAAIYEVVP